MPNEIIVQDLQQQIDAAQERVHKLQVTGKTIYDALELMDGNHKLTKAVDGRKAELLAPVTEQLKQIRSAFGPLEEFLKAVDMRLKEKIGKYYERAQAEMAVRAANLELRLKEGRISHTAAGAKMEEINSRTAMIPVRRIKEVTITDRDLVPDEYWELNMSKLRADALERDIPGTKVVTKTLVVNR